jgi:hypothetical protein
MGPRRGRRSGPLRSACSTLRDHDDREQFLAGIDLILTGVTTIR